MIAFFALAMRRATQLGALALLLSACTSTSDVLEPAALAPSDVDPLPQAQFPMAGSGQPPGQLAAITSSARVQFAPVVGATSDASAPLAARLSARATARGITLAAAGDASATHIMRGYFSAISDNGETTVIYVWDVVDPAGSRIHRIQGQARTRATAGGWSGVDAATMEAIADQTVDQLAAWLVTRQG